MTTNDRKNYERALDILHRLALEHTGWRYRRWVYSDEPLRNDAANLIRHIGYQQLRPENSQLVGDDNDNR